MPDKDPVTGTINHIRRIVTAIADGRIEARSIKDMTDEQVEEYISRLRREAREAVNEGYAIHETGPE